MSVSTTLPTRDAATRTYDPEFKPAIPKHFYEVSTARLIYVLLLPFVTLFLFGVCVYMDTWLLWLPMVVLGAITFQRAFTNCHNLVHGSYPLPKKGRKLVRDVLMTLYGFMFYYVAHLFKATHYAHHRKENRCGLSENPDPETVAHLPGWYVLLFGPVQTIKVFAYGFKNAHSRTDRVMGLIEVGVVLFCLGTVGCWMTRLVMGDPTLGLVEKTLALYGTEAAILLWAFPFNAAWIPHRMCRPTMLGAARNTPGLHAHPLADMIARVFVAGTRLHLVHHTWPSLATCNADKVLGVPEAVEWMEHQDHEHDHDH